MKKLKLKKLYILPLVLSVVMLVTTTYAWYVGRNDVEIGSDSQVSIGVDKSGLEIAVDGESFTTSLKIAESLSLSDITGDGINFWYPNVLQQNDLAPKTPGDFNSIDPNSQDKENTYLISFTLTFRTNSKMDIYLASDSFVQPKSYGYDNAQDKATPSNPIVRKSSGGGNFSADCIAGCARVAFVEEVDGTETLKNLWIPNPYIELHEKVGDEKADTCATDGKMEAYQSQFTDTVYNSTNPYGYVYIDNDEVKEYVFTTAEYASGKVTVGKVLKSGASTQDTDPKNVTLATSTMVNNAKKLLSFEASETPVKKSIKVRIWFEGTDREANRLLNGGLVDFNLKFVGVTKTEPAPALVEKLNALTLEKVGISYKLMYDGKELLETDLQAGESYEWSQNGYYWWDYTGESSVESDEDHIGGYVRLKETADTLPSVAVYKNIA